MKKMIALLLLTSCLMGSALGESYSNPILLKNSMGQVMDAADPYVFRFNGMYYLYSTGAAEIRCYQSRDLVNWEYMGHCTQGGKVNIAYAPEVFYWRGDFYMITSPMGNGHYILKSDSPLGPFEPATGNFGYSIDGSLFALDNGELWMFCLEGNSIKQTKINENTLKPEGVKIATGANLKGWTEGPGLIRRGEWNYLTFCGNHYLSTGYRVAWASRKGEPVGQYTQRQESTLLINSEYGTQNGGLGHSSNFFGPDLESIYTSYHCHSVYGNGHTRYYCLDRLLTNGGMMYSTGPSADNMPVPEMPEAYGDLQADAGHFIENDQGYFAAVQPASRFTQECSFILNGGMAAWKMGSRGGENAMITVDGEQIAFVVGHEAQTTATLPELGRQGRIHILRIEHTPEKMYVSIDSMQVLTVDNPGVTADTVGAFKTEGANYSFIAHTGRALGDGDYTAVKSLPGKFAAVHALDGSEMRVADTGEQEEMAAVLGSASYNVRVQKAGKYRFDLTVSTLDAGKEITITLGDTAMTCAVPSYGGKKKAAFFTFATPEIQLPQGDHKLTISGQDVTIRMAEAFLSADMEDRTWDLSKGDKKGLTPLGFFSPKNGAISIAANKCGYVTVGKAGCTDYEMRVKFLIPRAGSGTSGFFLRGTHVSYFDNAMKDSFYGYSVAVSPLGLNVRRIRYGAVGSTEFCSVKEWANQEAGELILRAEGNCISIFLPGMETPILTLEDADAFTHGMCGLFSTGKELTVTEMSVRPLEDK
ncbi:MAG: hypothetical protein E7324_01335 [Clostridiales bacterium]|nr:hypothetical protein [Clostridiales bacterium]